jgi:hypothetical protein
MPAVKKEKPGVPGFRKMINAEITPDYLGRERM